ncbi:glycosyltransferase, partial [Streptococcus pneumoniae]
ILGKYISKIYLETKKRPLYLIKEKSDDRLKKIEFI